MNAVLAAVFMLVFALVVIAASTKLLARERRRRRGQSGATAADGAQSNSPHRDGDDRDRSAPNFGGGHFGGAGATAAWTATVVHPEPLVGGDRGEIGGADGGDGDGD